MNEEDNFSIRLLEDCEYGKKGDFLELPTNKAVNLCYGGFATPGSEK